MERKILVRIDHESVSPDHLTPIVSASCVQTIDAGEHCYRFLFDSIVFDHAALLLGQHPERFGYDLSHYISTASLFFNRIMADAFVVMPSGESDFKRRMSEDLGVAIGSTFMVQTLSIKWETISQIPTNQKLNGLTPDFVAFDIDSNKYVFESKGTTRPESIDAAREKAKKQLRSHQEAGIPKLALVAYFPNSQKLLPPYLFVSDPPIPLPSMNEGMATGIHFLKVLEFAGLEQLRIAFLECLRLRLTMERKMDQGTDTWTTRRSLRHARESATSLLDQILQQHEYEESFLRLRNQAFAGITRVASIQGRDVKAFMGVEVKYLFDTLIKLMEDPNPSVPFEPRSYDVVDQSETFSIFSNGTILSLSGLGDG